MTTITTAVRVRSDRLLRLALRADALISGVSGVLMAATAGWLAPETGLPKPTEYVFAAVLIAYGVVVYGLSTMESVRRPGIVVAIGNVVFTVAAILAVVDDVWPLTTTGVALMFVSAAYTLVMADLQYLGVRRA
ncbi:MAG: hypothetical protein P4L86_31165 [Mycobacterium sp.]|nr:hypothetical protein [Mycobacterium sp.]